MTLPLFANCDSYYAPLWRFKNNKRLKQNKDMRCTNASVLHITFEGNAGGDSSETMDNIWNYLFQCCGNVSDYRCIIDGSVGIKTEYDFQHLMGHNEKLQKMEINHCGFFRLKISLISLNELVINAGMHSFADLMKDFNQAMEGPFLAVLLVIFSND